MVNGLPSMSVVWSQGAAQVDIGNGHIRFRSPAAGLTYAVGSALAGMIATIAAIAAAVARGGAEARR